MSVPTQLQPHAGDSSINLKGVTKTYHSAAGDFPALVNLDARITHGEFVSVMGKSGSGKSTLANMITGIDHPSSGQVLIDGVNIHQMSESQRAAWRGLNLGIIFQFFQLLPNLTLLENVMLPMDFCHKYERSERPQRALKILAQVGLDGSADALPASVSGGEQQRAAIARALANDPPIIVADEPTGNLDSATAATIYGIFEDLVGRGKTIIMVTHDPDLANKTQRQLLLADGELINPAIAAGFNFLPHKRMLWLTHQMESLEIPAGTNLHAALPDVPGLLLVAEGALEANGAEPYAAHPRKRFSAGSFLSRLETKGVVKSPENLRWTSETKTRVLWLPQAAFDDWMNEEPEEQAIISNHQEIEFAGNGRDIQGARR